MIKMILTILLTTLLPGIAAAEKRMMMNTDTEKSSFAGKHVMTNTNPEKSSFAGKHVMTNSSPNIGILSHEDRPSASQKPLDIQNLGSNYGNK